MHSACQIAIGRTVGMTVYMPFLRNWALLRHGCPNRNWKGDFFIPVTDQSPIMSTCSSPVWLWSLQLLAVKSLSVELLVILPWSSSFFIGLHSLEASELEITKGQPNMKSFVILLQHSGLFDSQDTCPLLVRVPVPSSQSSPISLVVAMVVGIPSAWIQQNSWECFIWGLSEISVSICICVRVYVCLRIVFFFPKYPWLIF